MESVLVTSCDDIITLSASIIGNDIKRTYEWVQISGTAVNWLEDRFQTDVMFQQPVSRDDKVFSFYMDRGLSTEVKKDVLVTSVGKEEVKLARVSSDTGKMLGFVAEERAHTLVSMPGFSAYGQATIDNSDRTITWVNPLPSSFRSNVVQEKTIAPNFYSVQKANYYQHIDFFTSYKITSTLDMFGVIRQSQSLPFIPTPNPGVRDIDISEAAQFSGINARSRMNVLEIFTRELSTLEVGTDNAALSPLNSRGGSLSMLEIMTRELSQLVVPDETVSVSSHSTSKGVIKILETINNGLSTIG